MSLYSYLKFMHLQTEGINLDSLSWLKTFEQFSFVKLFHAGLLKLLWAASCLKGCFLHRTNPLISVFSQTFSFVSVKPCKQGLGSFERTYTLFSLSYTLIISWNM